MNAATATLLLFIAFIIGGIVFTLRLLATDTKVLIYGQTSKKITKSHVTHISALVVLAALLSGAVVLLKTA